MTLLKIELLSINTHMQTSPALPCSSLRPQQHPGVYCFPWANSDRQGKKWNKKERENIIYTERTTGKREWKGKKKKASSFSKREMGVSEVKWEEAVDKLSDSCVRCVLQPPPLPVHELCFGSLPKDIPFFSLSVPNIYRHEAAVLLLLHHISSLCLQIKLLFLPAAKEQCENKCVVTQRNVIC